MKKLLLSIIVLLSLYGRGAIAQEKPNIKVFLDCQSNRYDCFEDFLRTEIPYVEFVRDRFLANLHVLPRYIETATGGVQVQLSLIGQKEFAAKADTLHFVRELINTDAEYRDKLLHTLKIGLVPYLVATNQLDKIQIMAVKSAKDSSAVLRKESAVKDPWNYWVFRAGIGGLSNGDNIYHSSFWGGNLSASRITEKLKVNFAVSNNVNKDSYEYETEGVKKTIVNKQIDYFLSANAVRSLTKRWSAGGFLEAQQSIFQNYRSQFLPTVGVEYDLFPYSAYNEKYILLRYTVGPLMNTYNKLTIYDKLQETNWQQQAGIFTTFVQKWGNVASSVRWSNFLNDFSKNSLALYLSSSIRLAKGLNLTAGASYSSIHNLINLEKGDVSEQDLLLKRRQLATSYKYFAGIGLSYTFGSIYNNVVNPRFNAMNNNISLSW